MLAAYGRQNNLNYFSKSHLIIEKFKMIESCKNFQNVLQTRVYLKYPIAVAKAQAGCGLLKANSYPRTGGI